MIHHQVSIYNRNFLVRVDDLPERERVVIRESNIALSRLLNQTTPGNHAFMSALIAIAICMLVVLGVTPWGSPAVTHDGMFLVLILCFVVGGITAIMDGVIMKGRLQANEERLVQKLHECIRSSERCAQLMHECSEALPWLKEHLHGTPEGDSTPART